MKFYHIIKYMVWRLWLAILKKEIGLMFAWNLLHCAEWFLYR